MCQTWIANIEGWPVLNWLVYVTCSSSSCKGTFGLFTVTDYRPFIGASLITTFIFLLLLNSLQIIFTEGFKIIIIRLNNKCTSNCIYRTSCGKHYVVQVHLWTILMIAENMYRYFNSWFSLRNDHNDRKTIQTCLSTILVLDIMRYDRVKEYTQCWLSQWLECSSHGQLRQQTP